MKTVVQQPDAQLTRRASESIRSLLGGNPPGQGAMLLDLGEYTELWRRLVEAYGLGGTDGVKRVYSALAVDHPELHLLASETLSKAQASDAPARADSGVPSLGKYKPLPERLRFAPHLVAAGCPWLTQVYEPFSRRWAPRAAEGFHRGAGIWLLSTVAAGRVICHFGPGPRKTNLYLALTAKTGIFTKTTVAKVARAVLRASALDWLLLGDDNPTPQKFLHELAGYLPANYGSLDSETRSRAERRYAFSGQIGWYYDEFSQFVAAMNKQNGHMTEFRGILRWMDDDKESYQAGTIGRGEDAISEPYLALLANMTPDDMKLSSKRGSTMWGDGFWARFAFITPLDDRPKHDRWPSDEMRVPGELSMPLAGWHQRLGEPHVEIVEGQDKNGKSTGEYQSRRLDGLPRQVVRYDERIVDAFYAYNDALLDMVESEECGADVAGNYIRFSDKAWRMACLFASLDAREDAPTIELRHWALAQDIAEEWRMNLHALIEKVNEPAQTYSELIEEKILGVVQRFEARRTFPTMRNLRQNVYGVSTEELARMVKAMTNSGQLEKLSAGRTEYYRLPALDAPPMEEHEDGDTAKSAAISLPKKKEDTTHAEQ